MKSDKVSWDTLDWAALGRLRGTFLSGKPGAAGYWTSAGDLANYDFTYAQRIGWKWDAVLGELKSRGWTPPAGRELVDWGCGSGVAGRRVLECFGARAFTGVRFFDRSPLAMEFAAGAAGEAFPGLRVEVLDRADQELGAPGVLVISHVLNELDEEGGRALRASIDRSDAVLWVEPGTHADSRALIAMREVLREEFVVVAPCTHQAGCGLRAVGNERHWCHSFAAPPAGIMADGDWVRFAQQAGIDLRSLPYSCLVLERRGLREPVPGVLAEGASRLIGEARLYKGYAKVLSCQEDGAREWMLQKRDEPELFKSLKAGRAEPLWRWEMDGTRIASASRCRPDDGTGGEASEPDSGTGAT